VTAAPDLPVGYVVSARRIADRRMILVGCRLADLLRRWAGSKFWEKLYRDVPEETTVSKAKEIAKAETGTGNMTEILRLLRNFRN